MAWKLYRVTYQLESPLHIGFHKVGNVQRTRYYVPARNLWGAVTERLTRSGFSDEQTREGDYVEVGLWVKAHCALGYFFLCDGRTLLHPRYTEQGLIYRDLDPYAFEKCYLGSHVTTALDAVTTSAETGSLHEVEFIAPYRFMNDETDRTRLCGWVFLDDKGRAQLGNEGKWRNWLGELQVGGERRYGFGRLKLLWMQPVGSLEKYPVQLETDRPRVKIAADSVILAHALAEGVEARGMIEPLVGRETSGDSARFGTKLTTGRVCWVPGSTVSREIFFQISEIGIWSKVS